MTETQSNRELLGINQRYQVLKAVEELIEPDGDKHIKYKSGLTEVDVAKTLSKQFGFEIPPHVLKLMRQKTFGEMKKGGGGIRQTAYVALKSDMEGLRAVVAGLTAKVETLRKIIEHHDTNLHNRRVACSAKLREVVGKGNDLRVVQTAMRGAGFDDDAIAVSMLLNGAVIRQNGATSTVQIPSR